MNQIIVHQEKYWIISFSLEAAHIIEAEGRENVISNPEKTFMIYYRDLKYKYMDIDEQVRKRVNEKKSQIDPRILFDPSTTIDDLLSLPQNQEREDEREYLARNLKLLKNVSDDFKEKKMGEYDEEQHMSEQELYWKVRTGLQLKSNYVPKEIEHFTVLGLTVGLLQSGYITGLIGFSTIDEALATLYNAWENLYASPEKIESMQQLENIASNEAERRLEFIFEDILS